MKVLVLEADGGVRSCCFNAVTCAVAMANLSCGDLVVACGCTPHAQATTLKESRLADASQAGTKMYLDPNQTEITKYGELTLVVTMSGSGAREQQQQPVVSMLCDSKVSPEDLEECMDVCSQGCRTVGKVVRTGIMEYMRKVATVSMH